MTNPLISVIVPIYNVENYLQRCVESIINQTYKNLEIILVNDGSQDNCFKICSEYEQKDSRVKVIHKKNGGLSDARNAGLQASNGDYICFIDSDDYVDLNMISDLYNCIVKDNSDVVSCGVRWVDENDKIIRQDCSQQHCVLTSYEAMKELLSDKKLRHYVWNKLYKKSLIKNIQFLKDKYNEDVFWSYQVIGSAKLISVLPNIYYNYLQRSNSIMSETYSEKRLDALDGMHMWCEYIKKNYPDLYNYSISVYMGSCMYHLQCALKIKDNKNIKTNIINRISVYKKYNISQNICGKQQIWLKMFCKAPVLTCKIRNILRIGL